MPKFLSFINYNSKKVQKVKKELVDAPMNDLPTGKHTQTNTQACNCVTDS